MPHDTSLAKGTLQEATRRAYERTFFFLCKGPVILELGLNLAVRLMLTGGLADNDDRGVSSSHELNEPRSSIERAMLTVGACPLEPDISLLISEFAMTAKPPAGELQDDGCDGAVFNPGIRPLFHYLQSLPGPHPQNGLRGAYCAKVFRASFCP